MRGVRGSNCGAEPQPRAITGELGGLERGDRTAYNVGMSLFAEDVERLPEVIGTIIHETDRYDGPIGGFVEAERQLFRFDWCQESRDAGRDLHAEPRLFFLSAIPADRESELRAWIERDRALGDEAMVLNNPHIYPLSQWQKERMRPLEQVTRELDAHGRLGGWWTALPVTHCMRGLGDQFAGMQVARVSRETWTAYEAWRIHVARALVRDEYPVLKMLLETPPMPVDEATLFVVHVGQMVHRCDARGAPLGPHFWMTARHRIEDLTGFALERPKAE